jgi:DNA-binding LytR/AlgR family response regulator
VNTPTALIAEDEPLLAAHLKSEFQRLWPELQIVATVGHGEAAVTQALALRPQVLFLDIRMPGMTGLQAAQALAEDWPDDSPFPLLVFVTAYDQHALEAFEQSAIDYVLKPVQPDRLARTCERLRQALALRSTTGTSIDGSQAMQNDALDHALSQLRQLIAAPTGQAAVPRLTVIQASKGSTLHMLPVDQVVYFEAADKYVRVVTADEEHLIRTSLRDLLPQLDPQRFWQVHRGTVVRADAIDTATRDEAGKLTVTLRGHRDTLQVSRLYAHLFKAM